VSVISTHQNDEGGNIKVEIMINDHFVAVSKMVEMKQGE
jgi:hypothetical protein